MAQKGRTDLTSGINSNIYDNNNKEILAAMVRNVLEDFRDSNFNLIDDELKNVTYKIVGDTKITLEQYLNSVIGSLPVYGTIIGVDPGGSKSSYTTDGIISSCTRVSGSRSDTLLEVNFSQSISNRRLIPVLTTTSSNWDAQNDVLGPVIRRLSSTRIHLALREVASHTQDLNIEIIAL